MLEFIEFGDPSEPAVETATLRFEQRQKSRQRVTLDSGKEAGILLPHGQRLRGGDVLRTPDGCCVRVIEANEPVSLVTTQDPRSLARLSYHLGNRHVAVQINETSLRYTRDHVLDEMVRELGLQPVHEMARFEPENGAYSRHSHAHRTANAEQVHSHDLRTSHHHEKS
jgi:urease accessory protein